MSAERELLLIYLLLINVISFAMFGIDKYKAKRKKWRIPEATLLFTAVLGGAAGAYAGMKLFHHKTLHRQFRLTVPLCLAMWMGIVIWLILFVRI